MNTCDDAISRDAVLEKAVYTETEEGWGGYTVDVDYIKSLPSVNPQPKTGHWIYKRYGGYPEQGNYHCSECDKIDNRIPTYCPHCWCAMIDSQESEEQE